MLWEPMAMPSMYVVCHFRLSLNYIWFKVNHYKFTQLIIMSCWFVESNWFWKKMSENSDIKWLEVDKLVFMVNFWSYIWLLFLGCCGCCQALKPRYKRLIDSIFPDDPEVFVIDLLENLFSEHIMLKLRVQLWYFINM